MERRLIKAIKQKCRDCSGNSKKEVQNCHIESCSLYPFRNGLAKKAS